uniref:Uncharacterized protein n=1 Tax=Cacopsylla melanoneura TaxID=428564 RepID=A0A8D8YEE6_9HEMI
MKGKKSKWVSGKIVSKSGYVNYYVEPNPGVFWKRHVDQLLKHSISVFKSTGRVCNNHYDDDLVQSNDNNEDNVQRSHVSVNNDGDTVFHDASDISYGDEASLSFHHVIGDEYVTKSSSPSRPPDWYGYCLRGRM